MSSPRFSALLVRLPAGAANRLGLAGPAALNFAGLRFELEPMFAVDRGVRLGLSDEGPMEWHIARTSGATDERHAWQLAHEALAAAPGLAMDAGIFIEPDLEQEWLTEEPDGAGRLAATRGQFDDQVADLPGVKDKFAWHLLDDFSQLASARRQVSPVQDGERIRIAHLDTGYDPGHKSLPAHLADQRNFVDGEEGNDARDRGSAGILKNPGHGTGTLSILAGGNVSVHVNGYQFDDFLGGAPEAEIVPVRVGKSVVQLKTSGIARGIAYAAGAPEGNPRAHVLSMSMGGVASAAWADAVNQAYEKGIVLVTAAGNNFSLALFPFPTRLIVYPARFRRVIAACGVMANRRPYYGLKVGKMQGNWGPPSKMDTAISAYTPNISWAEMGSGDIIDMCGAGTSSATPQVAAAAALYLQKHAKALLGAGYPGWKRVEAVRHALFTAADKGADDGSRDRLGNGLIRAAAALAVAPADPAALRQTPRDSASFAFLKALTGLGIDGERSPEDEMFALEATQLAQRWASREEPNAVERAIPDPDLPPERIPLAQQRRFVEALLDHPEISPALREHLDGLRGERMRRTVVPVPGKPGAAGPEAGPAAGEAAMQGRPFTAPEPPYRQLRGFAIDPSLSTQLATARISEIDFKLPWEPLRPGPVGEYLEVIDVDPASNCMYEPVNLDDPRLLAQDGLAPSEGSPQFHQQMVYAVASLTIRNFERALGRKVLWRPGPPPGREDKDDSHFVQRLRIYPHALRQRNAYYSPGKIALLFGYFNEVVEPAAGARPGPMVFTCLSHDIVAHETTHALLDGMHRRFLRPSNPDVLAFHEAFADIVALFQHFTFPEILRHEISSTRGEIRTQQSMLGQLARQFGQASGRRGALRDAIGRMVDGVWVPHAVDPHEYQRLTEPHDRGGILVAAVFDAFLSIYERRTVDLLRIASGGTGVLQPGAIHPDLVGRLADEAAKTAGHVLTMCVRALDYMPPVDITFGEYLRAIITADVDVVPDDDLDYRVAFLEAFRRRGIQPRDVRTLSVESLLWRRPDTDELQPSPALEKSLDQLRGLIQDYAKALTLEGSGRSRRRLFHLEREARRNLHATLKRHFLATPEGRADARFLGLEVESEQHGFEVHRVRFAMRASPDGDVVPQLVLSLLQEVERPGTEGGPPMAFEGGCAIVVDLNRLRIRYVIRKSVGSVTRLVRQRAFAGQETGTLRATYFGETPTDIPREPFALLHGIL